MIGLWNLKFKETFIFSDVVIITPMLIELKTEHNSVVQVVKVVSSLIGSLNLKFEETFVFVDVVNFTDFD